MRIVAGRFGGRRLPAAVPSASRPTSDRVREALFSALQSRNAIEDAYVLDLFAGTGALGLEALSRGARCLLSIDRDSKAVSAMRQNATALGVSQEMQILRADLEKISVDAIMAAARHQSPMDLVLLDPPYASVSLAMKFLEAHARGPLLHQESLIVLEHGADEDPPMPSHLQQVGQYRYGDTTIVLMAPIA